MLRQFQLYLALLGGADRQDMLPLGSSRSGLQQFFRNDAGTGTLRFGSLLLLQQLLIMLLGLQGNLFLLLDRFG